MDVVVDDKLNYKKAYLELVDCIKSRYESAESDAVTIYCNLLDYIKVIEVRNQGE